MKASIIYVPHRVEVRFAVQGMSKVVCAVETYNLREVDGLRCWRANERLAIQLSVTAVERRGYWSPAVAAYGIALNNKAMAAARESPLSLERQRS